MNVNRYTENESLSLFVAWSKEPIPKWFLGCLFFDEGDFFSHRCLTGTGGQLGGGGRHEETKWVQSVGLLCWVLCVQ